MAVYQNPPLAELVCGIHFQALRGFLAPHLGLLWETFREDGFEKLQEAPPLPPTPRQFDPSELPLVPPLPRVWYVSEDDERLIQVQRDRLLFNWRRTPDSVYPGFDTVFEAFCKHLKTFHTFLRAFELGELKPVELELTYVNHLQPGPTWRELGDVGKVFVDFAWRSSAQSPVEINYRNAVPLADVRGLLVAAVRSARRAPDDAPILMFELSAKGAPDGDDDLLDGVERWFRGAHAAVNGAFERMTTQEVRAEWRG